MKALLQQVSAERLRRHLFHLSSDPIRFRKVNYTAPGSDKPSLDEADEFIRAELEKAGLSVTTTQYRAQAFRCDETKPVHHWYSAPMPGDPWYDIHNLEVEIPGRECPEEIIQLVSHKDSMSWIDSPGAGDNAVGTVANMELARVLAAHPLERTVRVLFCNEEHTPWTSQYTAEAAAERGDKIIAVLNQDSLTGKSDEDRRAGRQVHAACYSTDEGNPLAEFIKATNRRHEIGLDVTVVDKGCINDDDGMFINAGYRTAVTNIGTCPYADAEYHLPGDCPERVDMENLLSSTRLVLATVLDLSKAGTPW